MKRKNVFFMICFLLATSANGICGQQPAMRPGLWEITTRARMEGDFAMDMPATTMRQCLTENDFIPQNQGAKDDCQVKNIRVQGDTVNWDMTCPAGDMHGEGRIVYKDDSFSGTMVLEIKRQKMKMTNKMKGRRVGDCP